jgi:archaellum component FlaC
VRISPLSFVFALLVLMAPTLPAQDPAAQQDAEAAREKLLKAEDELDNIQTNSEATKTSVDGMKTDVTALQATVAQLQSDNAALKQQLATLQSAFDQYKADQTQQRQALIDNVASMIAAGKNSAKPLKKKKDSTTSTTDVAPAQESAGPVSSPPSSNLAPPPDLSQPPPPSVSTQDTSPAPAKPRKGYYHVVAEGETLTMICAAYRDNGINVTVSEVRRANGLTENSTLRTGQKLFIPKPGT